MIRRIHTLRVYTPGRVIHPVIEGSTVALCGRSVASFYRLPADPWARIGAEAGTSGPCMRCMVKTAPVSLVKSYVPATPARKPVSLVKPSARYAVRYVLSSGRWAVVTVNVGPECRTHVGDIPRILACTLWGDPSRAAEVTVTRRVRILA